MQLFVQLLADGIVLGLIYGAIAVGFALIYNTTRIFHVPHGAVFTLAGYAVYITAQGAGWPLPASALAALAIGALVGAAMEVAVYRPMRLRGATPTAQLVAAIGVFIVLQNVMSLAFGNESKVLTGSSAAVHLGPVYVAKVQVVSALVALGLFALLAAYLRLTRVGRQIRAVSDDIDLSEALGVKVDAVRLVVFVVGSLLAAAAAVLVVLDVGVRPDTSLAVVLVAAVAVIAAGSTSLPATAVAAVGLGILQNLAVWQIKAVWQNTVVFAVLILVLLYRTLARHFARRGAAQLREV